MTDPISSEQRAALRLLVPELPAETYLANGVAIAATLRHRSSRDLDFFLPRDFDPERMAERLVAVVAGLVITSTSPGTLYLELHGVQASLLAYRYPLLAEPQSDFGDADSSPLPEGLSDSEWARIKRDFERWVIALG